MSELSFSALILNRKSVVGKEDEETAALQRALEVFYDAGVEDIVVSTLSQGKKSFQGHPVLNSDPEEGLQYSIWAAASAAKGTHLLVLAADFCRPDSPFFIRLMQMSCLGMGVLPFFKGVPEPRVACYPVSIRTLGDSAGERLIPDENALGARALAKGMVARYDIPPRDRDLFHRSDAGLEALNSGYFSSR